MSAQGPLDENHAPDCTDIHECHAQVGSVTLRQTRQPALLLSRQSSNGPQPDI
jgi:hypothetical protein